MPAETRPAVTFGMIVLNGSPFLRHNLRALYPFASQIIVVEGACPGAAAVASRDGHSLDGTLEILRSFCLSEDPDHKVEVVTAEDEGAPDGFWLGEKTAQSQAFARRACGEFLWQVDVDEFYRPEDMAAVLDMLTADPEVTAVSFDQRTFWGDLETIVDGWYLRRGAREYHRLFRWRREYRYIEHRPPTVTDSDGVDLRTGKWVRGHHLAAQGICMYHYSLLLPRQVRQKCVYFEDAGWRSKDREWYQEVFVGLRRPFRVHNVYAYPSWFERFVGEHPPEIVRLWGELTSVQGSVDVRDNSDVRRLLSSRWYRTGRMALKHLEPVDRWLGPQLARIGRIVQDPIAAIRRLAARIKRHG